MVFVIRGSNFVHIFSIYTIIGFSIDGFVIRNTFNFEHQLVNIQCSSLKIRYIISYSIIINNYMFIVPKSNAALHTMKFNYIC